MTLRCPDLHLYHDAATGTQGARKESRAAIQKGVRLRSEITMTDKMSNAARLVRQTFERLIKEYPRATDAQLLILLARAARADDQLKNAAFEWTKWGSGS